MRIVGIIALAVASWPLQAWGAPLPAGLSPAKGGVAPVAPLPATKVDLVVTIRPDAVVAQNVRGLAVLYRVSRLDEMKLFDVADRIAQSYRERRLVVRSDGSRAKLAAYEAGRKDHLTKEERSELTGLVEERVQMEFEGVAAETSAQMSAYADLVTSVARSLDDFRSDNTTPSAERDNLADRTWTAAHDLALTMSNRGYGATQLAATRLADQVKQALALLEDGEVQEAYGARGLHDLIAKQAGSTPAEVGRLDQQASAGSRLLDSLADNAALFTERSKSRELARRLASEAPSARAWLAAKPTRPAPSVVKKARVLCFDTTRRLVPCRLQRP